MTNGILDPPKTANPKYISRVLSILHPPGSTIELRFLGLKGKGRPYNAAGYFRDFAAAGRAAVEMEKRKPDGIYVVMNQVSDRLYNRGPDQVVEHPKNTTTDADIMRRHWVLIDVDPVRPAGISSTIEELQAAEVLAADVRDWLVDRMGWLEPIEAMSGNGHHLLFPVDLPNDDDSRVLVEQVLKATEDHAETIQSPDSPLCHIDTGVFNASRIIKLYGTLAGKGFDTAETPHRRSHIIHVPEGLNW